MYYYLILYDPHFCRIKWSHAARSQTWSIREYYSENVISNLPQILKPNLSLHFTSEDKKKLFLTWQCWILFFEQAVNIRVKLLKMPLYLYYKKVMYIQYYIYLYTICVYMCSHTHTLWPFQDLGLIGQFLLLIFPNKEGKKCHVGRKEV